MKPSFEAEWEMRREPVRIEWPPEPWTIADKADFCVAVGVFILLVIALAFGK